MEYLDRKTMRATRALPTQDLVRALQGELDVLRQTGALAIAGAIVKAQAELAFYTVFHRDERAAEAARVVRRLALKASETRFSRTAQLAGWRAAFYAAEVVMRFPALRPRPRPLTALEQADRDLFDPAPEATPEALGAAPEPISGLRAVR